MVTQGSSGSTDSAAPPQYANREEQLLDIARRLFAYRGYAATSLRDIAEEARISKAALYYHFQNKSDLYERVVIQSMEALVQRVTEEVARFDTPTERVHAFMRSSAEFLDSHLEHWLAGAHAFREEDQIERRSVALQLRDAYEKLLRGCIAEGIEAGDFRDLDAAMATRFLLSSLNYVTRWHSPTGKLTVKEVMEQFVDMALLGITTRPSGLPGSERSAGARDQDAGAVSGSSAARKASGSATGRRV